MSACPLCNEKDSQQHWIRECQASTLPNTRSQYISLVKGDIRRERRDKHEKTARWMEIILDIAATHPQGADIWVGMWPPSLRQVLKLRFESSSNYANTLTNMSEKTLVFLRKALKDVSKTLAEAVSELWTERAAAIKLMEQGELAQVEQAQQQWRGSPLPSNQPTIESFWQSPTPPTPPTQQSTTSSKNKKFNRLRRGRRTAIATYKTPKVQRSMEGYIQRTQRSGAGATGSTRGGSSTQEGGAARRGKKRGDCCSSNRNSNCITKFFTASPQLVVENENNDIMTQNTFLPNKRSPTGIG